MSDLTDYEREIVAAADDLAEWIDQQQRIPSGPELRLCRAVQAKRDAQRPRCDQTMEFLGPFCAKPATQAVVFSDGGERHRCDDHRVQVREL